MIASLVVILNMFELKGGGRSEVLLAVSLTVGVHAALPAGYGQALRDEVRGRVTGHPALVGGPS